MRSKRALLLAAATALLAGNGRAEPMTPARDDEVLVTLPKALGPRQEAELAHLERYHRSAPEDAQAAEQLARTYLEIGRRDGDPRYYGRAKAVIAPWGDEPAPPEIMEQRAEIKGFAHAFAPALEDYDLILKLYPARSGARLARAVLRTVIGDPAKAAADCEAIDASSEEGVVCRMIVSLARGDAATALKVFAQKPDLSAQGLEVAAEAAALAREDVRADELFRQSLAREDRVFTRIAFADFLYERGRVREMLDVLPKDSRNLGVMVRRAAALAKMDRKSPELAELSQLIDEIFRLERERGDAVHGRELSLYLLRVKDDAKQGFKVAQDNWATQKERIDYQLLAEAKRGGEW